MIMMMLNSNLKDVVEHFEVGIAISNPTSGLTNFKSRDPVFRIRPTDRS